METEMPTLAPLTKGAGKKVVRLQNAVLEEKNGEIIAKGWLALPDLGLLRIDPGYQREFLTGGKNRKRIVDAIAAGKRLPTVLVGMRGYKFHSKTAHGDKEQFLLEDACFLVDGYQRVENTRIYAHEHPDATTEFGIDVEVKFNTNFESELNDFLILNSFRTPISPNILLRNERSRNKAIDVLLTLCEKPQSKLYGRVSWDQNRARGTLFTATAVGQAVQSLHTGSASRASSKALAETLDSTCSKVTVPVFRENIIYFFDVMEECFRLSHIEFREKATAVKGNFLLAVAMMFARNENFWHGRDLVVTKDQRRRLARFPVQDPEVSRLAAAGAATVPLLYDMLVRCMNKGVRPENRLRLKAKYRE